MNLVLERPGFLLLMAVLPPLFYLRHLWPARGGRARVPVAVFRGIPFRAPATLNGLGLRLAAAAYWGAWVVMIVALAGPTRTIRERIYLSRGIDVMIVIDQSASMAARDFQPLNRFDTARTVIRRFIEQRPNDHVGLVGFSAEAALRVAPTLDHRRVNESLEEMLLIEYGDGTAIGMALALATLHLQNSQASERIIVLLTDGVNNAGEISPEAAARAAAQTGVRIYAVGVGTGREASIEVRDPRTGQLFRGTVRDSFDEASLRALAEISGGQYYAAGSAGTLQVVFDAIAAAQSGERRFRVEVHREPVHRALLIWALGLLLAEFVLRRLIVGAVP